jgi:hypothetical protein
MTLKAKKFTPEVMLTAPRRSAGIPNGKFDKLLYSTVTHSFSGPKKAEIRLYTIGKGDKKGWQSSTVTDEEGASEPTWLGDQVLLTIPNKDKSGTEFLIGDPEDFEKTFVCRTLTSVHANTLKEIHCRKYRRLTQWSQSRRDLNWLRFSFCSKIKSRWEFVQ